MAGAPVSPATQVPPSPQKESTNLHYPSEREPMPPGCSKVARALVRFGLERESERLLEQVLDARQELRAVGPVEDAVVADERERHLVARDHAPLVVHRGLLGELADGQDRRLRRVDDRGELLDPEHAEIRDREGAARQLRWGDGLVLDLLDHRAGVAGDLAE